MFILDDTRLYVVDGSSLKISDKCMLSDHIEIRTTDNHAIYDINSSRRLNYEQNVYLHESVWVGTRVIILKGVEIPEGCIIGAGSVVTKSHDTSYSVLAGNPAKMVRENTKWTMSR